MNLPISELKLRATRAVRQVAPGTFHLFASAAGALRIKNSAGATINPSAIAGTPVNGVKAVLSTNLANTTDNDLDFTARAAGVVGHGITVAYVMSGAGSAVLSVVVTGSAIVVTAGSATTAATVKTAVEASPAATALVAVTLKSGNATGAGAITTQAATALAGGVDNTPGTKGDILFDATKIYVASVTMTTDATSGWLKGTLAAL